MGKKLLVVFGATGRQGGSVIRTVLDDPELSHEYALRAITRDASKSEAKDLIHRGVEVVLGDAEDINSLPATLKNVHTVFINTLTIYDEHLWERELGQGKSIADAAVAAGAKYIIYSTALNAGKITGTRTDVMDSKAEVEAYIRSLPVKSAFFAAGVFMDNYVTFELPRPSPPQPGNKNQEEAEPIYAISSFLRPDSKVPLIEPRNDSGKYVGAILAKPDEYAGRVLYGATGLYSYQEIAATFARVTGKKVVYNQIPVEIWRGLMPEIRAKHNVNMFGFIDEVGFFGPEMKERVDWTAKQARGKLTTLEEFLTANPPAL